MSIYIYISTPMEDDDLTEVVNKHNLLQQIRKIIYISHVEVYRQNFIKRSSRCFLS